MPTTVGKRELGNDFNILTRAAAILIHPLLSKIVCVRAYALNKLYDNSIRTFL